MRLLIQNLDGETRDEELRELVRKYTGLECSSLSPVPGDGSRPGMLLAFDGLPAGALEVARTRLDGLFWQGHALRVQCLHLDD